MCVCVKMSVLPALSNNADKGWKKFQTGAQPVHFGLPSRLGRKHTQAIHTVGHFSVRLCDISAHVIQAWQRMSACLPAIPHLSRENQRWPQKLNTVIGARLEKGLQIRGTRSARLVS